MSACNPEQFLDASLGKVPSAEYQGSPHQAVVATPSTLDLVKSQTMAYGAIHLLQDACYATLLALVFPLLGREEQGAFWAWMHQWRMENQG